MKIDWQKIEILLAERSMRKGQLAQLMEKHGTYITRIQNKAAAGEDFQPFVVGSIAKALGVPVTSILEHDNGRQTEDQS